MSSADASSSMQGAGVGLRSRRLGRARPARGVLPAGRGALWPCLLVGALVVPWMLPFGSLSLSIYRIVLLIMTLPSLLVWVSGRAGPRRLADFSVLFYCAWCAVSFMANHGPEFAVEPAGMLFLETAGAYFIARCFVRSRQDFVVLCRVLFATVAVLLPVALIESIFGFNLLLQAFGAVLPTIADTDPGKRLGFWRVQGPFDHPILFGVFASSALALTHLVLGRGQPPLKRWLMDAVVVATTALSLSAGPITALVAQMLLLGWNAVLGHFAGRWRLLWGLVIGSYLLLELATSQSVMAFYITNFSFDVQSAWHRLLLMEYGWGSVLNHAAFGVGFHDWDRPSWMYHSIDMFWLVVGVRHGLPALLAILLAFALGCFGVGFRKNLDAETVVCRTAWLIVITGYFMVGWTVHFWNATYVLLMFLLGSGMWILDVAPASDSAAPAAAPRASRRPGRRVPQRVPRTAVSGGVSSRLGASAGDHHAT